MSGYGAFPIFRKLTLLLAVFAAAVAAVASPLRSYNDDELRLVARLASRVLVQNHYRGAAPDAAMSRRFYEQYLKELDPGRIYFTDADLAPFDARSDGICQALLKGDYRFAFELYGLYKARNRDFRDFAVEYLKRDIDFTVDEYFQIDRSKAPRPKTPEERRELWRLRLKNDVLYFRMIDRMLKEEQAAGKDKQPGRNMKLGKQEDSPAWRAKSPAERVLARLRDVGNNVDKREPIEILGMYLGALANSLGPHSGYAPPTLDDDFDIRMSLTLIGIGATLTNEDGFIKVVALVPGGPAALDGRLKVNDRIIAVTEENGETTDLIDMPVDRAVRFIRGKENSRVTLTVLPGDKGRNAHPVNIPIVRKKVHLEESAAKGKIVESADADDGKHRIGIATLPGFYLDIAALRRGDPNARRCSADLKRVLQQFNREKVDAVVVDLRRNSGGSLPEAIHCSGLFMTKGPVVQIRSGDRSEVQSDNDPEQVCTVPVVVLNSKLSASSSEIFAAALRDNSRAVLVGDTRTFGKGTILQVEPLEDSLSFLGRKIPAGLLTYEMAMFFRVAGGSPQQLGIPSDVVIPSLTEEMKVGEMYLDNHLPWDSIAPIRTTPCDPALERKIPELRRRSAERVAKSREFAVLKRRVEMYRRFRDRDKLSLNEKVRWEEYRREKDAEDAAEKLLGDEAPNDADNGPDPVLDEAAHIAADLAELGRNTPGRNTPEVKAEP